MSRGTSRVVRVRRRATFAVFYGALGAGFLGAVAIIGERNVLVDGGAGTMVQSPVLRALGAAVLFPAAGMMALYQLARVVQATGLVPHLLAVREADGGVRVCVPLARWGPGGLRVDPGGVFYVSSRPAPGFRAVAGHPVAYMWIVSTPSGQTRRRLSLVAVAGGRQIFDVGSAGQLTRREPLA